MRGKPRDSSASRGAGKNSTRSKMRSSSNTASIKPILLPEYFRPSNGQPQPFSQCIIHFHAGTRNTFQFRTDSPSHLVQKRMCGCHENATLQWHLEREEYSLESSL